MAEQNQPGIGVKFPPLLLAVGVGAIGAWLWHQSRQPLPTTEAMAGRICVVTGANAGIGKATAMALAQQGAHVVLACRCTRKGNAATTEIRRRLPSANLQVMPLDLESIDSIRGFVKLFSESKLPLHVLINNAGMMTAKPETVRGMEKTMVVNHLGPFLLTMLLLPNLRGSAAPNPEDNNQPAPASRIINVASRLEKRGQLPMANDPATPAGTAWFKPPPGEHSMMGQYGTSKLCNMLFTFELHRRLAAATAPAPNAAVGRVTVNAVTPGLVNTNLGDNAFSPWLRSLIRLPMAPIKALFFRNVDKGAETVTWAASSPAVEHASGKFYGDMAEVACSKTSQDPELARKLWEASEVATGLNKSERVI